MDIELKVSFSSEGRVLPLYYSRVYKFDYSNMHSAEKAAILASRRQVFQYSHFSPFIRLWIVFLDWITTLFRWRFLKSKLTNISYKDMQNLSSPSDCIQFPVSDNERMKPSWIIHISDSRNSTVNWSWGVETQTGFEYINITKYIMIHYLSYKINDFHPPVM